MRIVVTGPESSGKTTLAESIGGELNVPVVPEIARAYLTDLHYQPSDLLEIARRQLQAEKQGVVCDTDLQVIAIWWAERFGPVPQALGRMRTGLDDRAYLLCRPDLPWEVDPLRENPDDRGRLFELYKRDLDDRQLRYAEVFGDGPDRVARALAYCRKWLSAT